MPFLAEKNKMNRRVALFLVIIAGVIGLLLVRLFSLQVTDYDKYQQIVVEQLTSEVTTTPERGKIYDTNMNLLVTNTTVYTVFISPYDMAGGDEGDLSQDMSRNPDVIKIAEELVTVLGADYDEVIKKAGNTMRKYEVIKKNVDPETASVLRAFAKENGYSEMLCLSADSKRYYCYDTLACHLLGFTNADGEGIYGVESAYNDYLKGVSGKYITARNAVGGSMPFKYESYVGEENGAHAVLTLDLRLQYALEEQLEAAWDSAQPSMRVCGIAMDVNDGSILAMGTYPSFDCNSPYIFTDHYVDELKLATEGLDPESKEYASKQTEVLFEMWRNKCVSEIYEPGSTFKPITASVALEIGAVKPDDKFTCTGSYLGPGFAKSIACHKLNGHGEVTFARGLQQSCNPTLMMTIERIGLDTFYKYFEAYGYMGRTGIDLPAEAYGITYKKGDVHAVELANFSFGQSFKTTPIQQLTAISAIANGGYLVTPHVMKEMVDDDGNVLYTYEPEKKAQIISSEVSRTLTDILEEGVATDGGARNAYVKGYKVAAKTGTTQKLDKFDEEGNISYRIGSTVAFAPADDPQIAVLIMVDEPTVGSVYGSVVAAPYVSKFLSVALPYLGYEPHYTEEELKVQYNTVNYLVGYTVEDATAHIANRFIKYKVIGNGSVVTAQSPQGPVSISTDDGIVYLFTNDIEPSTRVVPDVMGMTPHDCNSIILNSGLNIRLEGASNYDNNAAEVISQYPEAGTEVKIGTIVTVEIQNTNMTD